MKNLISAILLVLCSNHAYGSYISVDLQATTPFLLTNEINIVADFGAPGNNITINNLTLDFIFDQNILDLTDNLIVIYKWTDFMNIQYTIDNITLNSFSLNLNDPPIFIDQNGQSILTMSASGSGVNISSLTLTGDVTVVPLPSSLFLLVSGLIALIGMAKSANKSLNLTAAKNAASS